MRCVGTGAAGAAASASASAGAAKRVRVMAGSVAPIVPDAAARVNPAARFSAAAW